MKFTDGYWMIRKGFSLQDPKMIYEAKKSDTRLILYAPFMNVRGRGYTLNLGMMTIEIEAPLEGVLRIHAYHHKGAGKPAPVFETPEERLPLSVEETETAYIVCSGSLKAVINRNPYSVQFFDGDKYLTESGFRGMAYITGPEENYVKEELSLSVGETVYGLGERLSPGKIQDIPVGKHDAQAVDMAARRAVAVGAGTGSVAGNHTADGAGGFCGIRRKEKPFAGKLLLNAAKTDTGASGQAAGLWV